MMKSIKNLLMAACFLIVAQTASAQSSYLNVSWGQQEHSEWCWSATSQSVLSLYKKTPSQCQIVNWAYGLNYACGNTTFAWNSPANKPNNMYGTNGSVQTILQAWGVPNTPVAAALTWNQVVWDINNRRPFVIRYGWTTGGGHIMTGYGYQVTNGVNYIRIMDSWPGEGWTIRTHSSAVSASDHKWTHSLRMNNNAPW
jgi:hypothetical protein